MKGYINIKKAPVILFIILLCNGNKLSMTVLRQAEHDSVNNW